MKEQPDKKTALFWVIRQRVVEISYRRLGTIYRSHPQAGFKPYRRFGTTNRSHPQEGFNILEPCMKMGPIDCSETSVRNYHYSLHNNPEERSSPLLRAGSLKSRTNIHVQMSRTRKQIVVAHIKILFPRLNWLRKTVKFQSRQWKLGPCTTQNATEKCQTQSMEFDVDTERKKWDFHSSRILSCGILRRGTVQLSEYMRSYDTTT